MTRRRPTSGPCGCATSSPTASLITFDGDGHTAYTRSNGCVDDAVDGYYLTGTVPKDGLTLLSPSALVGRDSRCATVDSVYSSGVPEPARAPAALAQSARAIHS